MHPICEKLEALAGKIPNAKLRRSNRGVPHLVVGQHSICWFRKTKIYRVFHPYPAPKQTRRDFKRQAEVVNYVTHKEVRAWF